MSTKKCGFSHGEVLRACKHFNISKKGSHEEIGERFKFMFKFNCSNKKALLHAVKQMKEETKPAKEKVQDNFLSSFEWRKLRMLAIEKYGAKCQCCGATPKEGIVINVDHIKPRKLHPELALDINNLQILCNVCNHGKGNWSKTDWRV